jgi:hypothetical protein
VPLCHKPQDVFIWRIAKMKVVGKDLLEGLFEEGLFKTDETK